MSIVVNGTLDVLSKALKNFAGEDKTQLVRPSEVILIIGLSDVDVEEPTERNPIKRVLGEPFYRVIKQGKPYMRSRKIKVHPGQAMTDEVSFLQVLDSKVDFFQMEGQAKPFLIDAFRRFTDEMNGDLLNNPDFNAYVESEVAKQGEGKSEEEKQVIKAELINENSYSPYDLEIWVITAKKQDKPGAKPQDQDSPVQPIAFLYARGEKIRQLHFAKDIFQMEE